MKNRYFTILINLALLMSGLIFSLLMVELFFRISPNYSNNYGLSQYIVQKEDDPRVEDMNAERPYRVYMASDILGYELVSNSDPGVNAFGMVGRIHRLKKSQDVYRILVLGDSITEYNWYVEQLEDRLNNYSSQLGYTFEVWNGGVSGYQINQYAAYFKYKGLRYNPDMLLIGFCLNDFGPDHHVYYKDRHGFAVYYNNFTALSKVVTLNRHLFKNSYLYRFLISESNRFLLSYLKRFSEVSRTTEKSEGAYYLKRIKDICQKKDIPLIGIIFPYFKTMDEYDSKERRQYQEMTETLNMLQIDFIDLHNFFPEKTRHALIKWGGDYTHPAPVGHAIAAREISRYLIRKYFTE